MSDAEFHTVSNLQESDPLQPGGLDEVARRTACEDGACACDTTTSTVLRDVSDSVRPLDGGVGLPRVGSLVRVQWRDAWFELDYDDETVRDDYLVHTVGFVIKNTDKFLHIAAEMLPDNDGFRGITAIPVSEVTNWKEL